MDDTISRQKALDSILGQPPEPHYPSWYADIIQKLSPAEQKTGEWLEKEVIDISEDGFALQSCKCSVCGRYDTRPYMYYFSEPHYCSWCGVKMKGERQ